MRRESKLVNLGFVIVCLFSCCFFPFGKANAQSLSSKPETVRAKHEFSLFQADPTIFLYKSVYYLYGTNDGNTKEGIKAYSSTDMKKWKPTNAATHGFALKAGECYGTAGFWAPQVWHYDNKFYMAYVANEHIAIATSNSPVGPFKGSQPIAFDQRNIDPFVFIDADGKKYLFHVDINDGNRIYVVAINDAFTKVDLSTRKLCISATEPWETIKDRVTEGPTVIKHRGYYYLIYSANNFVSPDYAVGYATSKNINGPWIKYEHNPILSRKTTGKSGSGHGDIFFDKDHNMYYVFHTHNSDLVPTPRRTAIVKAYFKKGPAGAPDVLVMDGRSMSYLKEAE